MRTEARKKTEAKYRQSKLHRVAIDYKHADFKRVASAADGAGLPVGTYIRRAVDYAITQGLDFSDAPLLEEPTREPMEDIP